MSGRFRWRRWMIGAAVACGLVLMLETVSRCFFSRSLAPKILPAPHFERIELIGASASGTVLDGHGGWFNEGKPTVIIIRSSKKGDHWDCPSDITIRNGRLRGSVHVMGMGGCGQGRKVRESSHREGHTARVQAAAPTRVLISNVEFMADHRIPVYLAPGVTHVTLENCTFAGWSSSVAVYLDAESGRNIIRNNTFAARVSREVLAVDGSAENRIESNRFDRLPLGGIYLYRNCGEGGTVRHQTPHGNVISGNRFTARSLGWRSYGIWLGSRNGYRPYSEEDAGYAFGSSVDNRDFANGNTVTNNVFLPPCSRAIRDDGENNLVSP